MLDKKKGAQAIVGVVSFRAIVGMPLFGTRVSNPQVQEIVNYGPRNESITCWAIKMIRFYSKVKVTYADLRYTCVVYGFFECGPRKPKIWTPLISEVLGLRQEKFPDEG